MRTLVLGGAALLALGAAPAVAQQTSVSAASPSSRSRAAEANAEEMVRLVNELRAREARLLRELASTPETELGTRRSIELQLARTAREAFAVMSVIEARCLDQRVSPPRGHLGMTIDNDVDMRDGRVARSVASIASVEPGSPAAAAGLQAGDRLISIAGRDFSNGLPRLSDVLEPGRRVVVRIQRDGAEREVPVTVGQGTPRMDPACPEYERVMQPLRMGTIARVWVRDTSDGDGNRFITVMPAPRASVPRSPNPPTTPVAPTAPPAVSVAPTPPVPPAAPPTPGVYVFGYTRGATSEFAYYNGAQLRQLDDDWRGVLGLRSGTEGVLVNEVAPGSAAAAAGLRSGDVILSVDGTAATSPLVVVRLMSLDDRAETRLRVVRARETRTVVFKHGEAPRE